MTTTSSSSTLDRTLVSERLKALRSDLEARSGQRVTDEELARLFGVSKSTIANWKRDAVRSLQAETERRFRELTREARDAAPTQPDGGSSPDMPAKKDTPAADALIAGTVDIVRAYIERSPQLPSADDLQELIVQVKKGLAT